MGQQSSCNNFLTYQINHPKFKNVIFPKKNNTKDPQVMIIQFSCEQENYNLWKKSIQINQTAINSTKNLFLPVKHEYIKGGLCSKFGIIKTIYERSPYLLLNQIKSFSNKKCNFSEQDIWKLFLRIIQAKKQYLNFIDGKLSDVDYIHPINIFLNDKKQIKIVNPLSWPEYIDSYKSAFLRYNVYASPEDLKLLQLGHSDNKKNINSQIFSIGMTLLSIGLTEILDSLYDMQEYVINNKQFQNKLAQWKNHTKYSEILKALVLNLLERDPNQRLNFNELQKFLQPHSKNIIQLKPFTINNAPSKILKSVQSVQTSVKIPIVSVIQQKSSLHFCQSKSSKIHHTKYSDQKIVQSSKFIYPQSKTIFNSQNERDSDICPLNSKIQKINQSNNLLTRVKSNPEIICLNLTNQKQFLPDLISNDQIEQQRKNIKPEQINIPIQSKQFSSSLPFNTNSSKLIAQRLLERSQSQIKRVDSQTGDEKNNFINVQPLNPQSVYLFNKKKASSFAQNQRYGYHTYCDIIIISSDYIKIWQKFIQLILFPQRYFPQYKNKIITQNDWQQIEYQIYQAQVIEIPPGKAKLHLNKEEGKITLENLSLSCKGDIIGGVQKLSNKQVKVWFNSSYSYKGNPFPKAQYLKAGLNRLRQLIQNSK